MGDIRKFIRAELERLVAESSEDVEETVDDVLIDYMEGVLDPANEDEEEEDIITTIVAYIPSLSNLSNDEVGQWYQSLRQRCKRVAEGRKDSDCSASSSNSQSDQFSLKVDDSALAPKKESSGIDPTIKDTIVNRHAVVGEASSGIYRPTVPPKPTERNTKVRYYKGQVVNTKGHRFIEPKKEESEEMKKTYINLKPAKQYRFH